MISLEQYAGVHMTNLDWSQTRRMAAIDFLSRANALMAEMETVGVVFPVNPKTKSQISGETYGGFRPQNCPIGAPRSCHKEGIGVDLFDPDGKIDAWCMANQTRLAANGIWIEHPDATNTWSHWQGRGVPSGSRVFRP